MWKGDNMTKSNKIFKIGMFILLFLLSIGLIACGGNPDEKAAESADKVIALIPDTVTLEDEDLIQAAINAYARLSLTQKGLVEDYAVLLERIEDLQDLKDAPFVNVVNDLIADLPAVLTLEDKDDVVAARDAYDALTERQQGQITNLDTLEAKEEEIDVLQAAADVQTVIGLIADLPAPDDVTVADEDDIVAARAAYAALSAAQKALVTNVLTLSMVELELEEALEEAQNAADQAAAEAWDALVVALPTLVDVDDKAAVEVVRAAYDELTEAQLLLITMLSSLVDKETRIANLEVANPVIDLITALPAVVDVALTDETEIVAARTAYDAITADQQALVSNYEHLQDVEYELTLVKNPDLRVLHPYLDTVPTQIVDDFVLPVHDDITWSYKAGEDTSYYDLATGEVLKTTGEVLAIKANGIIYYIDKDKIVYFHLTSKFIISYDNLENPSAVAKYTFSSSSVGTDKVTKK